MIQPPVIRKEGLKIVSVFGVRMRKGEKENHLGMDIRTYRLNPGGFVKTWSRLPIVACEDCEVLRIHRDGAGNGVIVIKPIESDWIDEIKYIHLKIEKAKFKVGDILKGGTKFPHSEIAGQSDEHHLHFVVKSNGKEINPMRYFKKNGFEID